MALHPFIFAAQQLQRIGCNECGIDANGNLRFDTTLQPDSYLVMLATVINGDGSLNGQSPHAERFALCLDHAGNSPEALELFLAIMNKKSEILRIGELPPQNVQRIYFAFADKPGKLGYLAASRFAELAARYDRKDLATQLFMELVEKIPAECAAVRSLIDARVRALQHLKNLGVATLRSGASVIKELGKMRERQG